MKKKGNLRFNKIMVCEILGCNWKELDNYLSDEAKKRVGWTKGRISFTDAQVYVLLKDFYSLYSHEQIMRLIYPTIKDIPPKETILLPT